MALHPVEHIIYFGIMLIHWVVPSHPIREKTQLLKENHLIIEQPVSKVQQDLLPEPQTRKSEKTRVQTMLKNIHPIKKDRKWINIFEK